MVSGAARSPSIKPLPSCTTTRVTPVCRFTSTRYWPGWLGVNVKLGVLTLRRCPLPSERTRSCKLPSSRRSPVVLWLTCCSRKLVWPLSRSVVAPTCSSARAPRPVAMRSPPVSGWFRSVSLQTCAAALPPPEGASTLTGPSTKLIRATWSGGSGAPLVCACTGRAVASTAAPSQIRVKTRRRANGDIGCFLARSRA